MKHLWLTLVALGMSSAVAAQSLQDLEWVTEEYAPYNFTENGELRGISVEIIEEMWARLGIDRTRSDVHMLPWARGYHMAQNQPGTCLFSTTVTESREQIFSFVKPLVDTRVTVMAPRNSELRTDDLRKLDDRNIGVVREDIGELLLQEAGSEAQIRRTDSARSLVRMLAGERFDAIAYSYDTILWNMQQDDIDRNDFEVVYTLKEGVLGISCQQDTDPALIEQLQTTLDELHEDGTVAEITQRYVP